MIWTALWEEERVIIFLKKKEEESCSGLPPEALQIVLRMEIPAATATEYDRLKGLGLKLKRVLTLKSYYVHPLYICYKKSWKVKRFDQNKIILNKIENFPGL